MDMKGICLLTESLDIWMLSIGLFNWMVFKSVKSSSDHRQTFASWLAETKTSLIWLTCKPVTGPRWWSIFVICSRLANYENNENLFLHIKEWQGNYFDRKTDQWLKCKQLIERRFYSRIYISMIWLNHSVTQSQPVTNGYLGLTNSWKHHIIAVLYESKRKSMAHACIFHSVLHSFGAPKSIQSNSI